MVASSMNRQNTSQHTSKVESVGVRSRLPHQDVGHAIGMRRSPALGFRARYRDCAVSEQFAKAAADWRRLNGPVELQNSVQAAGILSGMGLFSRSGMTDGHGLHWLGEVSR